MQRRRQWKQWQTLSSWAPKSLQMVTTAMKLNDACSLEENYDQPRQQIKKQRHYFANKGPSSQSYGFSRSHVWMWELDYRAECWRIYAFEPWCWRRLLRVPWTTGRSNQSILKEVSPEYSLEYTDTEAEAPTFWPPDAKSWLIGKDPDAGKDWRQEEKGMTEDEMVGWHHVLNGPEFEQAPGVGDGQGSLACYSPWSHKESDMTELNWKCRQEKKRMLELEEPLSI